MTKVTYRHHLANVISLSVSQSDHIKQLSQYYDRLFCILKSDVYCSSICNTVFHFNEKKCEGN